MNPNQNNTQQNIGNNNPPQAGKTVKTNVSANPNSTQNMLQIAEIRDGIVIMNDGSYRAVIMVNAINFDLMSAQEKEAVEYSYQGFLNSLFFPVQIFIHSTKVDIQPYLDKLRKILNEQNNMLLGVLMQDYIYFMGSLAEQTNIMNKQFYIVVPYFPVVDMQKALTQSMNFFTGLGKLFNTKQNKVIINETDLTKAKEELANRVQSVLGALGQAGIQGLPLNTQELIELYYNTYNPDTAVREKLTDFDAVNAPIVGKGAGMAKQPNLDGELPQ